MSKATSASATEPTLDDSPEPKGTSRAVEAPSQDIYSTPYATDYAVARAVADYLEETLSHSEITAVEVRRMSAHVDIRFRGNPAASTFVVRKALPDDYKFDGMTAYPSGAVGVELKYVG
ncbi:hypothetical protein PN419_00470 [Halorubrum ezzemoulense]|uniref:hypothetical protein n=1 Tax=Halorubrum ezzemoulense TaxID=337243 RepID=UPI00232DCA3A|nr:hypothetical protein [Halorubrum ezzemoulense]MDB9247481.1 hypothetical protein [Halorubrum ezzemoulense]MDB9258610.1 hypothetical protein [Halorubrum ezzemoulense]MDB9264531.1 hypothetical protein [Halorubrum ezzemoulense]MDB9268971.1 hypothetical protein [Halorubrum ezzemoulense]MDB9271499.1 hypothetical protein [Halorubrum ezzemoulense]